MKPTSSLIAGGVLLFGAAALFNVFLPSPVSPTSSGTTVEQSITPVEQAVPQVAAVEPAPVEAPSTKVPDIAPPAASAVVITPTVPVVETPRPPVARAVKAEPPAPKKEPQSLLSSWVAKAKESFQGPAKTSETDTDAPVVNVPKPATPVVAPSVANAPSSGDDQFALSATIADKAWIRIGDKRTVMAKVGDPVPGLGTVTAIGKSSITIDGKKTLEVGK